MSAINGNDIINFIESNFNIKLPEQGLLAGQSVCSIYLYLSKRTNNVDINDIDIFFPVSVTYDYFLHNNHFIKRPKLLKNLITLTTNKLDIKIDNEYGMDKKIILNMNVRQKSSFEYIHSERNGILNFIYYKGNQKNCLEHFDINCTKIGVDLKNKKLIKLQDFNEFERNMEIKITNFDTPFHSIIRLASKIEQFKFNSSIEENILLTNSVIDYIHVKSKAHSFGLKYKNKINSLINPYYKINNLKDDKLFNLIPKDKDKFDINLLKNLFVNPNIKINDDTLKYYILNNLNFLYNIYKKDNKQIILLLNNPLNKQKLVYEYLGNNDYKLNSVKKVIQLDYKNFNLNLNKIKNDKQELLLSNEYIGHFNLNDNIAQNLLDIIYFFEKKYNTNLKDFMQKISLNLLGSNYTQNLIKVLNDYVNNISLLHESSILNFKGLRVQRMLANAIFCYQHSIEGIHCINSNYIYVINNKYLKNIFEVKNYLNSLNIECTLEELSKFFNTSF